MPTYLDNPQVSDLLLIARTTGPLGTCASDPFTSLVLHTRDVDCDGTSYAAHRVTVPTEDVALYVHPDRCDTDPLDRYLIASDQWSGYFSDGYEVQSLRGFLIEHGPKFDRDSLEGFCGAWHFDEWRVREDRADDASWPYAPGYVRGNGYLPMGTDWYPWAGPDGDDAIGTVLYDDTRL